MARRTFIDFLPQLGVIAVFPFRALTASTPRPAHLPLESSPRGGRDLDGAPIALHAARVLSLSSIGAFAWLLAALVPSSIGASIEPFAWDLESSIGSSVHATPDVDHVVSAEGRAFATSPVRIPEAGRAHGDASAPDALTLGAAILPRTLEPISSESFATRSTYAIAQTTSPRAPAFTPRSSRGPPSA